jgi:hypothetical protein
VRPGHNGWLVATPAERTAAMAQAATEAEWRVRYGAAAAAEVLAAWTTAGVMAASMVQRGGATSSR